MLNQVQGDGSLLKWRLFVGEALFSNTKNPFPEALEGNCLQRSTALRQAQGPCGVTMECVLRKV